ncbi:MAG: hypothetical protein HUU49_00795 [Candidatus Buchananbacteria bacterium]|nr:hypothetical protein [Candidatus Buchananbacteria bacterium]
MPLLRTFAELANGHEEMAELLDFLWMGGDEEWVCVAVIALTCDNPDNPLTGQALWDRIAERFEYVPNVPNAFELLHEVSYKADELRMLAANIASKPSIQGFFAEEAITEAIQRSQGRQPVAV